jgi:hypothetical protein
MLDEHPDHTIQNFRKIKIGSGKANDRLCEYQRSLPDAYIFREWKHHKDLEKDMLETSYNYCKSIVPKGEKGHEVRLITEEKLNEYVKHYDNVFDEVTYKYEKKNVVNKIDVPKVLLDIKEIMKEYNNPVLQKLCKIKINDNWFYCNRTYNKTRISWCIGFLERENKVIVRIDFWNKDIFNDLMKYKEAIKKIVGIYVDWDVYPSKLSKSFCIKYSVNNDWNKTKEEVVKTIISIYSFLYDKNIIE